MAFFFFFLLYKNVKANVNLAELVVSVFSILMIYIDLGSNNAVFSCTVKVWMCECFRD